MYIVEFVRKIDAATVLVRGLDIEESAASHAALYGADFGRCPKRRGDGGEYFLISHLRECRELDVVCKSIREAVEALSFSTNELRLLLELGLAVTTAVSATDSERAQAAEEIVKAARRSPTSLQLAVPTLKELAKGRSVGFEDDWPDRVRDLDHGIRSTLESPLDPLPLEIRVEGVQSAVTFRGKSYSVPARIAEMLKAMQEEGGGFLSPADLKKRYGLSWATDSAVYYARKKVPEEIRKYIKTIPGRGSFLDVEALKRLAREPRDDG
jgi:hypothetical protein